MKTDDVTVSPSKIQGRGVFASRDFKKGEVVLHWDVSQTLSQNQASVLSAAEKAHICFHGGKYIVVQSPEKYVNHSCNPNTTSTDFCDIAIRDIQKGEEITGNYADYASGGPVIKCTCGSKDCIGSVRS